MNHGQSQPGAFADWLGREKRLKNPLPCLGFHAVAGIRQHQQGIRHRPEFRMQLKIPGVRQK